LAKNEAKVSVVLDASKEILGQNGGKMAFQAWRDALTAKIGSHEASLQHIMKNKMIFIWLKGFGSDGKPEIWVVSDKSMIVEATSPLTKEGK